MTDAVDPAVTFPMARTEPLGISRFLPILARMRLVRAAEEAREYDEDSLARRRCIEDAVVAVKTRWPEYFKS